MKDDFSLNKILVVVGWTIALTINLSLFLAQAFRVENQYLGMFFAGFCRPLWACTIMWMVFMCSKGYGGVITKVLNSESLIRMSRVSFAAYLLNPILIFFVSMISDVPFHIELVSTVSLTLWPKLTDLTKLIIITDNHSHWLHFCDLPSCRIVFLAVWISVRRYD